MTQLKLQLELRLEIPAGLCQCGCNQKTNLAPATNAARGDVKGQPYRYIKNHQHRKLKGLAGHNSPTRSEYNSYTSAKARCENPKAAGYADYGGRGIRFLFTSFEQFLAELGPRPPLHSLDRIDVNGHYAPGGQCRWADAKTQALNRHPRRSYQRGPYGPRRPKTEKAA